MIEEVCKMKSDKAFSKAISCKFNLSCDSVSFHRFLPICSSSIETLFFSTGDDAISSSEVHHSPTKQDSPSFKEFGATRIDPPDDEPPSLKIESMEENHSLSSRYHTQGQNHVSSPSSNLDIDDQGFFRVEPALHRVEQDEAHGPDNFSSHYVSSVSESRHNQDQFENFEPTRFDEAPENENFTPMSNKDFQIDKISSNKSSFESRMVDRFEASGEFGSNGSQGPNRDEYKFPQDSDNCDEPLVMNGNVKEVPDNMKLASINQNSLEHDPETQNVSDTSYGPSDPIHDKKFFHSDKKQIRAEKNEDLAKPDMVATNVQPYNDIGPINSSSMKQNESNAMPNKLSVAESTTSSATESRGHQSPAMRGAHEILKRNRRRRVEV